MLRGKFLSCILKSPDGVGRLSMLAKDAKAIGPQADLSWAEFDLAVIILSPGLEEKPVFEPPSFKSQLCQLQAM